MNEKGFRTVRGYQLIDSKTKMTSSMEDYLEMILRHNDGEGCIRVGKLAELLNVKDSSATKMVQRLGALGFLHYEKYGMIRLSKKGMDFGQYLLKRHSIIEAFLKFIGTDNPLVETELLEHSASPETINNIETLLMFFSEDPSALNGYVDFRHALAGGSHQ